MGIFGSFSSKKSSGTQTGTIADSLDSLTTGIQSQTGTKDSTGSTSTSGSQSSTGSAAGTSTQSSTGGAKTQESQTSSGSQFGADVLEGLKMLLSATGGGFTEGIEGLGTASGAALDTLKNFNVKDFVGGIVDSASAGITSGLESSLNGLNMAAGGSADGNSMVQLLGGRLREDANAKLAGITSEATAAGNSIMTTNATTASNLSGAQMNPLLQLSQIIKGGESSQTGLTAAEQLNTALTTGSTTQQTSEQTNTIQEQLTALTDLISQLTNSSELVNSDSLKTLDTKTTGKESGFSLGFGK
jgi:hypothetical protein